MKVRMIPDVDRWPPGGIRTVAEAYHRYLPHYGVEFVEHDYDVELVHAGSQQFASARGPNLAMLHGLYWTEQHPQLSADHWHTNAKIAQSCMAARVITVPSEWVAQTIRFEMRTNPFIVPHGIEMADWRDAPYTPQPEVGYVLWLKNRRDLVCDPTPIVDLAKAMPQFRFITTFAPEGYKAGSLKNLTVLNRAVSTVEAKQLIQNCGVYLATTQETFGVTTLEALASGKPCVGYAHGHQPEGLHGMAGYLVQPGDIERLAQAVVMTYSHYDSLSENARGIAAAYPWENACKSLLQALECARERPHGLSIVIPAYNKERSLAEAIESALSTTKGMEEAEVIVVNDGSTDGTATILDGYKRRVKVISQENSGVAQARNTGIAAARYDAIVCLDGDDVLHRDFARSAMRCLYAENRRGIVYSSMMIIDENGKPLGQSKWPGEYDLEKQLKGGNGNQVPTTCAFRKEAWRRAGGYKSRYCPRGAGSEDARLWRDIALLGYTSLQYTDRPLFIHRAGGQVAQGLSKGEYAEPPWNDLTPAKRNFTLPPTPTEQAGSGNSRFANPIGIYYPPTVSVIIPVGKGHGRLIQTALDSLLAQTYRKLEIIVIWDEEYPVPEWILGGYPMARFISPAVGLNDAGKSRNLGLAEASAPFVTFLDADDWLEPDAIASYISAWNRNRCVIISDFYMLRNDMPKDVAEKAGATWQPWRSAAVLRGTFEKYDRERAIRQPDEIEPYEWAAVNCFLPTSWAREVGGFPERLKAWEDWAFHIRLARAGRDYHLIPKALFWYDGSSGKRRAAGREYNQDGRLIEEVRNVI